MFLKSVTLLWSLKATRKFSINDFNIYHWKSLFNFNIYHSISFLFVLSFSVTSLGTFFFFFDLSTTWDKTLFSVTLWESSQDQDTDMYPQE